MAISTVSRAMRNAEGVRPDTRTRVLDAAKSMGYNFSKRSGAEFVSQPHYIMALAQCSAPQSDQRYLTGMSRASVTLNLAILSHHATVEECAGMLDPRFQPAALKAGLVEGLVLIHRWPAEVAAQLGVPAYHSLDAVLTDPAIQAVALFTPPIARAKLITRILAAGRHVITTKPFEMDLTAAAVLDDARERRLAVHMNSPAPVPAADIAQIKLWEARYNLGAPVAMRAATWANGGGVDCEVPAGIWTEVFQGILNHDLQGRRPADHPAGFSALLEQVRRVTAMEVVCGILIGAVANVLGIAIFCYFRAHPDQFDPTSRTDQILPLFTIHAMPVGFAGLLIAAIFASAMSMVATIFTEDFFLKLRPAATDRQRLVTLKTTSYVVGLIATGIALYLATLQLDLILLVWNQISALLGGGIVGVYSLGMFTRRANGFGAVISVALTAMIKLFTPLHRATYLPTAILS